MSKYLKTAGSWPVPAGLWPAESFDCSLWRKDFSTTGFKHNLLWPLHACSAAKSRSVVVRRNGGIEEALDVRSAGLWSQAAWVPFSALPLTTCVISVEILDYQALFVCNVV